MVQDDPLDVGQPIAKPMSGWKRGMMLVANMISGLAIVLTALVLFLIVMLALPLWPLMPMKIRYFYCYLAGLLWTVMQYVFERVNGACLIMTGFDRIPEGESALLFSNHYCTADIMLLHSLASRKGMQPFCKYFIKDSVKYIPLFGWSMYLADFILLKRNWQKDQKTFERAFDLFAPRHGLPVYLIIFPEGSRLTEKKLKASQDYARANNLPILKECLIPRSKGLVATIKGLRAANSAVRFIYDLTLAYYHPQLGFGVAPSILDMILGRLEGYRFHVHVDRIPISDLPMDDEGLTKWTMDRFVAKDELLGRLREAYESNK